MRYIVWCSTYVVSINFDVRIRNYYSKLIKGGRCWVGFSDLESSNYIGFWRKKCQHLRPKQLDETQVSKYYSSSGFNFELYNRPALLNYTYTEWSTLDRIDVILSSCCREVSNPRKVCPLMRAWIKINAVFCFFFLFLIMFICNIVETLDL